MIISIDKPTLLKNLNEVLKRAIEEDKRLAAEHAKDEQVALKKFRELLKSPMNWDYKKAKLVNRYNGKTLQMDAPSCPTLNAPFIRSIIKQIKLDNRKDERFNIHENEDMHKALMWVPESEKAKSTVCE